MNDTRPTTHGVLRRVYLAQALGSTIDGIALSTAVLYFSVHVGIRAELIGLVLGVAAVGALVVAVPIGVVADLIGLRHAAIALSILTAAAFATYALARDIWLYSAAAILFVIAQAGIGAVRQAIVASRVPPEARVQVRAVLHTLLNAGIGAGTVIGTLIAALNAEVPFVAGFAAGSAAALLCALIFYRLPAGEDNASVLAQRRPGLIALRDRRFVSISALAAVVQLTMPVLSVLLPLWTVGTVHAQPWVAPAAIGLNTLIVLLTQTAWASRIRTDADAARSTLVAAAGLATGCACYGLAAVPAAPLGATTLLIAGTVGLTVGEITGGAGTWHLAFSRIPATSPGQYQAVFGMSASVARVLGPLLALPLMLRASTAGWIVIGLVMAAAALTLTAIGRATRTSGS